MSTPDTEFDTAPTKPVTIVAASQGGGAEIVYGDQRVQWPGQGDDFHQFWFVVLDRSDLSIVVNLVSSSSSQVPSEVAQYGGNNKYLLILTTNALGYSQVPTGDLATFIAENGGGQGQSEAEQVAEQAGSAAGGQYVYALFSIMGEPMPGIERYSFSRKAVLPASVRQFGGLWTPVNGPAGG